MRVSSRLLDHPVDLDAVCGGDGMLFVRDGVGVAGWGVAIRVTVDPSVAGDLTVGPTVDPFADFTRDDRGAGDARGPGVATHGGPVGFAAVPFDPRQRYELVVPEVTVRRSADGRCRIVVVRDPDDADGGPVIETGDGRVIDAALASLAERVARRPPQPGAAAFEVGPDTPVPHYLEAVDSARDAVRSRAVTKAVIARAITVRSDAPIDVQAVLGRLRASFGSSYRYSLDGLIGASPELLVAVHGNEVRSHPLAGTAPRTGDPDTDGRVAAELLASTKNQIEHRIVIDEIYDTLLPLCSYLDWQPEPSIVTVANVQHLGTAMQGRLSEPRPGVLDLVHQLRPTPALGGAPRAAALELIERVEGVRRGRYGGAIGWVDGSGDGEFAVTIRCAELDADGRSARLVAGGGIVAESDPLAELAETQAKFQAMLSAIVRP